MRMLIENCTGGKYERKINHWENLLKRKICNFVNMERDVAKIYRYVFDKYNNIYFL